MESKKAKKMDIKGETLVSFKGPILRIHRDITPITEIRTGT